MNLKLFNMNPTYSKKVLVIDKTITAKILNTCPCKEPIEGLLIAVWPW